MKLSHNFLRVKMLSRIIGPGQLLKVSLQYLLGTRLNRVRLKGHTHPLWWRGGNSDLKVIFQIFEFGECDIDLPSPPDLIIDGGANVGYSAVFFARKFPGVPILAIEPDPANLDILRRNSAPFPQIKAIAGAIWREHTQMRIINPEAPSWAFEVKAIPAPTPDSFQGFTVGELAGNARSILLKLDIEGAETAVFTGPIPWIKQVSGLVIEVHGQQAETTVTQAMAERNYRLHRQGEKLVFHRAPA